MNSQNIKYLIPTPGGAYYLTQDNTKNWQKNILKRLFLLSKSPELNRQTLQDLFNSKDQEILKNRLDECQRLQLIQVVDKEFVAPKAPLEQGLVDFIRALSKSGKVLLSDSQGFCIVNHGFTTEMSEEISVLSADIAIMHKRRALNIHKKLGLNSQAWSIVDASGNSCLGFWPLNIDEEVFVLVIEGVPFFNQPAIISLIWMLYLRYGEK